jgi:hypothetical protein
MMLTLSPIHFQPVGTTAPDYVAENTTNMKEGQPTTETVSLQSLVFQQTQQLDEAREQIRVLEETVQQKVEETHFAKEITKMLEQTNIDLKDDIDALKTQLQETMICYHNHQHIESGIGRDKGNCNETDDGKDQGTRTEVEDLLNQQLENFYQVHEPSKVGMAETLLTAYSLEDVLDSLLDKYGALPHGWDKLQLQNIATRTNDKGWSNGSKSDTKSQSSPLNSHVNPNIVIKDLRKQLAELHTQCKLLQRDLVSKDTAYKGALQLICFKFSDGIIC